MGKKKKNKKDKKVDGNLVLIDADSIIYIVGAKLENMQLEPLGIIELDKFIKDILIATGSKYYMGFFGGRGLNFRKALAVTKEYKGNRAGEKPDWFIFWEPILKKHMETVWGFQPCDNIEADDAVSIAAEKYRGKYNKVFVSSPDKDLFQIPDMWFYNYDKHVTVYVERDTATYKLCHQLITGDTSDNIPGITGAGDKVATKYCTDIQKEGLDREGSLNRILDFYQDWHANVLYQKAHRKQEAEYLKKYKSDNNLSRLTAKLKSEALKDFKVDTSELVSPKEVKKLYLEQYSLLKLLETESEGKKYKFKLGDVIENTTIDWNSIDVFEEELEDIDDSEEFEFMNDL